MSGGLDGVGEGVLVECREEVLQGFVQWSLQSADGNDGAGVRFEMETFHHVEVGFAGSYNIAQPDLFRLCGQGDSAVATERNGYEVVIR